MPTGAVTRAAAAPPPVPASAFNPVDLTQGFAVMVRGNATLTKTESEGPIAIGGNLTLGGSYNVAIHSAGTFVVGSDPAPSSLVVGGRVDWASSAPTGFIRVVNGWVKIGDLSGTGVIDTQNSTPVLTQILPQGLGYNSTPQIALQVHQPASTVGAPGLIDFAGAFATFQQRSSGLAACPTNVTLTDGNGNPLPPGQIPASGSVKITLTPGTQNVLNLTTAQLAAINTLTFNNSPTASTPLLINVIGSGAFDWTPPVTAGLSLPGAPYVLWNMPDITALTRNGAAELDGTLYAPQAAFTDVSAGNHQGNLIVASAPNISAAEAHLAPFGTFLTSCDAAPGALGIDKLITGPAAGRQGAVTIHAVCGGTALSPDFTIPANSPANSYPMNYPDIPAGSVCTVTETANGSTTAVTVTVQGSGQQATVPSGGTVTASLTDTYDFSPGSLTVDKVIAGPAAGQQGPVDIHTVCGSTALSPDLTIPAGAAAGTYHLTYPGIAAGSLCTLQEIANGGTATVSVSVGGDTQATIPAGSGTIATMTDTYASVPGSLVINKAVAGRAAGSQGPVVIRTVCGTTALSPDFTIPAGAAAGHYSHTYTGLTPGPCTVTETSDGHTSTVTAAVTGSPQTVTASDTGTATASLRDTYDFVPGSLTVSKVIAGPGAGQQGAVVIHTICDGTPLSPDLVVPAGSPAGSYSHTYTGVPGGAVCVVADNVDGITRISVVAVHITRDAEQVTVPPGGTGTASLSDFYRLLSGAVVVRKFIAGPAAGSQGAVTIGVSCTLAGAPSFQRQVVIPAGTPAGRGHHVFAGIPPGSDCTVTEADNGQTRTVRATVIGNNQHVTVDAGTVATLGVLDGYSYVPGALTVIKHIAGAAGTQGRIEIQILCRRPFSRFGYLIPAGARPGTLSRRFAGIAAGSECTVREIAAGATATLAATTTGAFQRVTIQPAATATATITDTYTYLITVPVTG